MRTLFLQVCADTITGEFLLLLTRCIFLICFCYSLLFSVICHLSISLFFSGPNIIIIFFFYSFSLLSFYNILIFFPEGFSLLFNSSYSSWTQWNVVLYFFLIPLKITLKLAIFYWLCKEMEFSLQCFFQILEYEFLLISIEHIVVELWNSGCFPGTP